MNASLRQRKFSRGFVSVYICFACMTLIPLAGLAIDFSILYAVKARLQSAVDAAAIGAGYKLQRATNMSDPTQVAVIRSAAQRYFSANYPTTYFGSSQTYYSSTPSVNNSTGIRSIYVHAEYKVPMIFMRVLRIPYSQVNAQANVNVRYTNLMIVVDRSGSVVNGGADTSIKTALHQFVADSSTSVFVDGRDYVGMVSFGGNWKLDYSPATNFQSSMLNNIGTAIDNIPFDSSSSTNTGEGLYQGWYQLQKLNQPGALNVILLLTDGRPSAFTGQFQPSAGSTCHTGEAKKGVIAANVGSSASQWPPPETTPNSYGIQTMGVLNVDWNCLFCELTQLAANVTGCAFASNTANLSSDVANFPDTAGPIDNPDGDVHGSANRYSTTREDSIPARGADPFQGEGTSTNNPRAVRYAAFTVADNIATAIRSDNTLHPVMFVIGLNESTGEPLDSDWLAKVANDPTYVDANGNSVYQPRQTSGLYYNVSASGLSTAFTNISSQILRLAQ